MKSSFDVPRCGTVAPVSGSTTNGLSTMLTNSINATNIDLIRGGGSVTNSIIAGSIQPQNNTSITSHQQINNNSYATVAGTSQQTNPISSTCDAIGITEISKSRISSISNSQDNKKRKKVSSHHKRNVAFA
jgi:spore coat protein U-like protein